MSDTATAPVAADGAQKPRPEKPDEEKYKSALAQAEKNHAAAQAKFDAVRAKLDNARSGKDSPGNDRFKELVEEQKSIRSKQQTNKSSRTTQQEKFGQNDKTIKDLIEKQNRERASIGFKNVGEIDSQITRLRAQVDAGTMKLVDEKKALAQISTLTKQRKGFSGLDDLQKQIDQKKSENTELKKTFDNPESRALAATYEKNQKELDEIKAAREGSSKSLDNLKAEREKMYNEQKETYAKIRQIKDEYFGGRKAYKEYEDTIFQQRRERMKAEREAGEKEKRQRIASQKLEEAREPAYLDQIRSAEGLVRHFDPSSMASNGDKGPGEFAATAERTVDDGGFKGMKVMKKEDEDFFVGGGGKKKGKGKKGAAAGGSGAPAAGKFNMNIGIIEELGKIGVEPPSTQADVPAVVEKLKEKVAAWKEDQPAQTEKNIKKAQEEIDRLEKEATDASASEPAPKAGRRQERSKKVAQQNAGANVDIPAENELEQEKDAAADVTKDLKEASIEDKENEALEA